MTLSVHRRQSTSTRVRIREILLGVMTLSAAQVAAAQTIGSNAIVYGAIDTSLRYQNNSINADASGYSMESGAFGGSHFGIRGHENISAGLYAAYRLEAGFTPATGAQADSERLFGREAWVGLGGDWGQLSAGRHYTLTHGILSMTMYDAFGVGNYPETGWYSGSQYTIRQDNSLKYQGYVNDIQLGLMYSFNERGIGDSYGAMTVIPIGPLDIALSHESDKSATGELQATLLALKYTFDGGTSLHAYTLQSRAKGNIDRKDQLYALGVIYPINGAMTVSGSVYRNLSQANNSGDRTVFVVRGQYALSKRAALYIEADHSRVSGIAVADFNSPDKTHQNTQRSTISVGYRYLF